MNSYRTHAAAAGLFLILAGSNLGSQADDNPFPDVIARPIANRPFDINAPKVKLSGVITQSPQHILPRNPHQYFRMAVMGEKETVIWAVLLIANDEEIANLKPGVAVTILATPTKDGSKRVELVQSAGPECSATCAGLTNLIVNR